MFTEKKRVSTGIEALDRRLDGLFIGDNVIWYDEAGSLAFPFCLNFIKASWSRERPLVYAVFDRSPKALLEALGPLAANANLTLLDCFTYGKGNGSTVFTKFYENGAGRHPGRIIKIENPSDPQAVSRAVYSLHQDIQREIKGDVRFVFESLTGMQDLWGGEEAIQKFYSRSCPHLYELETIAYWIVEKKAHSHRLKAYINQIAQVAIELNLKRGKSSLAIVKAHNRRHAALDEPEHFWTDGMTVAFDADTPPSEKIELGSRLKALRIRQEMAQKDLALQVGVTPSTISQIESNLIYPSMPALIKMAQVLGVEVGHFFQKNMQAEIPVVFHPDEAWMTVANLPKGSIRGYRLLSREMANRMEAYLLEIAPGKKLAQHFFTGKGEEFGYLLEGELQAVINKTVHRLSPGDVIYLKHDIPSQWKNIGTRPSRLLWMRF
jgi:transcriptional regulator with XRE-family HTH domain/KaiC/GvpD/RAD55 family RecA-like ATPase